MSNVANKRPEPLHQPELDALAGHWRLALAAADDAIAAIGHGGTTVTLSPTEMSALRRHLSDERQATTRAIASVAAFEHAQLHTRVDAARPTNRSLGLPDSVRAVVFDLDGVLTPTDEIHAAAWAETFDGVLMRRLERSGERFAPFRPFDTRADYPRYFHDQPRLDGVRAFLASRGISLPAGRPGDRPGTETVHGLANRKNEALHRRLRSVPLRGLEGSSRYLALAREAGLRTAVVSASANTAALLERAQLAHLIEARVDATTIGRDGLETFPAPDLLLTACALLDIPPEQAAVYVSSAPGVAAARAARAAIVFGVDRGTNAASVPVGADRIVPSLGALISLYVDPRIAA